MQNGDRDVGLPSIARASLLKTAIRSTTIRCIHRPAQRLYRRLEPSSSHDARATAPARVQQRRPSRNLRGATRIRRPALPSASQHRGTSIDAIPASDILRPGAGAAAVAGEEQQVTWYDSCCPLFRIMHLTIPRPHESAWSGTNCREMLVWFHPRSLPSAGQRALDTAGRHDPSGYRQATSERRATSRRPVANMSAASEKNRLYCVCAWRTTPSPNRPRGDAAPRTPTSPLLLGAHDFSKRATPLPAKRGRPLWLPPSPTTPRKPTQGPGRATEAFRARRFRQRRQPAAWVSLAPARGRADWHPASHNVRAICAQILDQGRLSTPLPRPRRTYHASHVAGYPASCTASADLQTAPRRVGPSDATGPSVASAPPATSLSTRGG